MNQIGTYLSFAIVLIILDAISYLILSYLIPDLLAANLAGLIAAGLTAWAVITFLTIVENQNS